MMTGLGYSGSGRQHTSPDVSAVRSADDCSSGAPNGPRAPDTSREIRPDALDLEVPKRRGKRVPQ